MSSEIDLPPSQGHTVKIAVINGALSHMPTNLFVKPTIRGHEDLRMANYSFLIENSHKDLKLLFDLAFMKNLDERMPPALKVLFADSPGGIDSFHDVPDTLTSHDLPLSSINGIIWSHSHIDHVGDPSVFPPSTDLIVGPGFRSNLMPGYPTNPSAFLLDNAFEGRNVCELDFSQSSLSIGGFPAIDYFDDGSFYLLHSPGHTAHHLCGLARTTDNSFILMAGDACHTAAQLRPSKDRPLPENLSPSVLEAIPPPTAASTSCSCARFRPLLPSGDDPSFYGLSPGMHEDISQANETVRKLKALDARDDVFVIIAHDHSLLDVVDFYPKPLEVWREHGWADLGRWRFLGDFKDAVAKKH